MGWGSGFLRVLGLKSSDGDCQKEYKKDKPKMDGLGFDKNEVKAVIALSLLEQNQLAGQEKAGIQRGPGLKSVDQKEEMDMAIALSRSVHDQSAAQKTETPKGTGFESEDDKENLELAIGLSLSEHDQHVAQKTITQKENGSLKTKSPPPHLVGKGSQSAENRMEEYEKSKMKSPSWIEHSRSVSGSASSEHPKCSHCHLCNKAITDDYEFSKSKRRFYHKSCYKVRHAPHCVVCKDPIPPDATGHIRYSKHHFWNQMYCPIHDKDRTAKCCSCERMKQKDGEYLELDDGRKLCLECLDSGMMDTDQSQQLYFEIREFYEGLNMKITQEFPLYLVERQALNHAREGEKLGYSDWALTRGLCLSEEQTVVSVLKGPRRIGDEVVTETVQLVRNLTCEVTAILIIYGLPRLLTGSILAHEMMHAWLRLNGYKDLKPDVEEGICQVMAHRWLESETFATDDAASSSSSSSSADTSSKKGKQPDFEKKLVQLFKKQIETDTSPDYGDGFRKGFKAEEKYGLMPTLKHIKKYYDFP